jgi:alpha-tubulin suppressor-like RCC1 family protein
LKKDATLWSCGGGIVNGKPPFNETYGQLGDGTLTPRNKFIKVMTGVRSISAGFYHSMVIKNDSSLWGFGWNGTADIF